MKIVYLRRPKLTQEILRVLRQEAAILKAVQGTPGFPQLYEVVEDEYHLFIVHEVCEGQLYDFLSELSTFDETRAAAFFRCISHAIAGMHSLGYLHRDIKPENILFIDCKRGKPKVLEDPNATVSECKMWAQVSEEGQKERWVSPRVIDLGMSDLYDKDKPTSGVVGSPGFIAPEVADHKPHTPKMDVYSMGALLFMLLTGKMPHGEEASHAVTYVKTPITKALHWRDGTIDKVSSNAKDLMSRMMDQNPSKRPTMEEVLKHPWLHEGGQGHNVLQFGQALKHATLNRVDKGVDGCLANFDQPSCPVKLVQEDQGDRAERKRSLALNLKKVGVK
jgi:serine/threonine protein kinase